jgi:Domain of unknown function (DUF3425)
MFGFGSCAANSAEQSDDSPSTLNLWDPATHIDPSLLIHDRHIINAPGPYYTATVDCGCSSPHIQIHTQSPTSLNCSYDGVKILSFGPIAAAVADPYANNLRIEAICIIAAFHTLGVYIGIAAEMLCAEESPSPFFRSSTESADDMVKANTVRTVQGIFKTLKPDLRPSREQITIKHHAYIDVLPFPTLRKNLLARQDEVDEDEFFQDILTGLVCWGGAGMGRRDRADSTGYGSTGTPWDFRSWEAKLWFLKKYWDFLGGEEGELVRQSEWWRGMRGDDTVEIATVPV